MLWGSRGQVAGDEGNNESKWPILGPDKAEEGRVVTVGWCRCMCSRFGQVLSGYGPSCTAHTEHRATCVVATASDGCTAVIKKCCKHE